MNRRMTHLNNSATYAMVDGNGTRSPTHLMSNQIIRNRKVVNIPHTTKGNPSIATEQEVVHDSIDNEELKLRACIRERILGVHLSRTQLCQLHQKCFPIRRKKP